MTLDKLDSALEVELHALATEGRAKAAERIITKYIPPSGDLGPRYLLAGSDQKFLRMNSNSYLSLANHPEVIRAADQATHDFGVGPGAVRFIDGTYRHHVQLEKRIAAFTGKPAAKIFNSAYTSNCGLALAISTKKTHWIGDQLNHNSIIRAMRIAGVPSANKGIFKHNDMEDLQRCLDEVDTDIERVVIIFDGVYSMRGDTAPIDQITAIAARYDRKFADGVITVVDDSHGIGAYGRTGRGTPEYSNAQPDIIVGTFGKAFGVNGGFISASETVIEAVRQKADTYIYTNPLSVADCSAAIQAIDICDSEEGLVLLTNLQLRQQQFREGLNSLGKETIEGPHPVIPLMVRSTPKTHEMVKSLYTSGVLVVGLVFPVVPRGDESIRFQINAAHREADIEIVLNHLERMG
jgi:glycine C-acetyltransferase